jgi:oligopeptide/dipeptide ABC transporter ATP-binding protein
MAAELAPRAAGVLEVRDLEVCYGTGGETRAAVSGFELSLAAGEIVGLTGASGSGKSTAAYALLGLVRSAGRVTRGSVVLGGRDLLGLEEAGRRAVRGREIALIVQNPRAALDPIERLGRQIETVARAHGAAGDARVRRAQAVELLRLVAINDAERRADAFAHELSGGMAQRVLIAMALSASPRVLVADEPTSGLDVTVQAQFLDLMWRKARESGTAMLLVTQEPGILANYCDRVIEMAAGRITAAQPIGEYFRTRSASLAEAAPQAAADRAPRTDAPDGVESPVLLGVEGLRRTFPVRGTDKVLQAVDDVSFELAAGETLGLVGESGSGKTTVGRCVLGLLAPSAGIVRVAGRALGTLKAAERRALRREIQFVRQDPFDSFDPRWTLGRSLREPLDLHGPRDEAARRRRVRELIARVGCDPSVEHALPRDLGAGALQRLNLARALATEPRFIVLDEPTSLLAPQARLGLIELLHDLQRERGVAYLFISHDLTTIASLCHRVAVMYLGQIVEVAATAEIFERPRHPYTRALIASHLTPDPERRRVDRAVADRLEGEIPSPIDLPRGCYLASRCPHVRERCRAEPQALQPIEAPEHLARCWRAAKGELPVHGGESG